MTARKPPILSKVFWQKHKKGGATCSPFLFQAASSPAEMVSARLALAPRTLDEIAEFTPDSAAPPYPGIYPLVICCSMPRTLLPTFGATFIAFSCRLAPLVLLSNSAICWRCSSVYFLLPFLWSLAGIFGFFAFSCVGVSAWTAFAFVAVGRIGVRIRTFLPSVPVLMKSIHFATNGSTSSILSALSKARWTKSVLSCLSVFKRSLLWSVDWLSRN